jgi:glycosyltransferase involved in cell wall biosynthesis
MQDLERAGVPKNKLIFIPYGIDVDFYERHTQKKTEEIIVSVGKDRGRDYQTLFAVAKNSPYPFWVAAMPRNIPHELSVPKSVGLHLSVPLLGICEAYARAKFVVVVSKDEDTADGSDCSGQTVILEAMASGKAVVATYRKWIPDYFDRTEIVTVPPNDTKALSEAVELLWKNDALRASIAVAGSKKVHSCYTSRILAQRLREIASSQESHSA